MFETLTMHVSSPILEFESDLAVRDEIKKMVYQALEKNPAARQKSVDEFLEVLAEVI